jgi:hypothetical protein
VPLIANLYASVEHDATLPAADGLLLLRRAAQMTYRRFVAVSVFANTEQYAAVLAQTDVMHEKTMGGGDPTMQLELSDLATEQVLGALGPDGRVLPLGATWAGVGNIPAAVGLGQLRLLPAGLSLARLTRADVVVSDDERDGWLQALRRPPVC